MPFYRSTAQQITQCLLANPQKHTLLPRFQKHLFCLLNRASIDDQLSLDSRVNWASIQGSIEPQFKGLQKQWNWRLKSTAFVRQKHFDWWSKAVLLQRQSHYDSWCVWIKHNVNLNQIKVAWWFLKVNALWCIKIGAFRLPNDRKHLVCQMSKGIYLTKSIGHRLTMKGYISLPMGRGAFSLPMLSKSLLMISQYPHKH